MNGNWKEAEEKVVKLPEDDVEIFELYVQLLYTGLLPLNKRPEIPEETATKNATDERKGENNDLDPASSSHEDSSDSNESDADSEKEKEVSEEEKPIDYHLVSEYKQLCKLYVFCDKVQDVFSKNKIVDAIIEATEEKQKDGLERYPSSTCISLIYDGTTRSSAMRRLLVDFYIEQGWSKWLGEKDAEVLPKDFLFDVAQGMLERRARPLQDLRAGNGSNYHEEVPAAPGKGSK